MNFATAFVIAAVCCLTFSSISVSASPHSSRLYELLFNSNFTGPASVWIGNASTRAAEAQVGFRNVAANLPVEADTRYPIASNTKLYVTVALYQLQENGAVNLSASVSDYLTVQDFAAFGFPNQTKYCPVTEADHTACQTITFIQLLSMSAGLPNTAGLQFMPYPGSIAQFVGWFIQAPLLFIPGTQYYYSNPSFMLCAYFIEKFSGLSFEEYLKRNIFDVINLQSTYYDPYNGKFVLDSKRTLEYYQYLDPLSRREISLGACSSEYDMGSASGAGGIVSDQADEAKLYFTLFNFTSMGKPLLNNPSSLLDIVRPRTFISDGFYYAQGLFVITSSDSQVIPDIIQYEGEIVCSHTMNYFYVQRNPQVLIQLWSAVQVAYVNETELTQAMTARTGNFFGVFSSFPHRPSLGALVQNVSSIIF